MFHFLLLLYVFLLIARVWCNTCSDYILWQLDGETWVACLHGVGDACNLVVALHITAIDSDAVTLYILHAQALMNGHDSTEVKDALQHRLLCILADGEGCMERLAWSWLLRSIISGNIIAIELLDIIQCKLHALPREGSQLGIQIVQSLCVMTEQSLSLSSYEQSLIGSKLCIYCVRGTDTCLDISIFEIIRDLTENVLDRKSVV